MPAKRFEPLTPEEFDKRLEASNDQLQQELLEAQERVRTLEALIARKETFSRRLDQMLNEIDREETEIAAMEKGMRPVRRASRQRSSSSPLQ